MNDWKKGELILLSSGEYSDYNIRGTFRCLQDISAERLCKIAKETQALKEGLDETRGYGYCDLEDKFIATLIRLQLIEDIDAHELHIGSYSDLKLSWR